MFRALGLLPALMGVAILSAPCPAQQQTQDPQQTPPPSLADVARQARKDREKNSSKAKEVVTDDNLSSKVGLGGLSIVGGDNSLAQAMEKVDEADARLKHLDALDRFNLAKAVLAENNVDFPGRRGWEEKLFAEKQRYVAHERELISQMRQTVRQIQALQAASGPEAKLDPNNPQVKQIKQKLADITQDATRTEESYKAVIKEGTDLAKQANR